MRKTVKIRLVEQPEKTSRSALAQKLSRNKRKALGIRIKPKEGMWISYQLRIRGLTQKDIADKLGLKCSTVNVVIIGKGRSTRIETAFYQTLGYPSFEAMIAAARGKGGTAS